MCRPWPSGVSLTPLISLVILLRSLLLMPLHILLLILQRPLGGYLSCIVGFLLSLLLWIPLFLLQTPLLLLILLLLPPLLVLFMMLLPRQLPYLFLMLLPLLALLHGVPSLPRLRSSFHPFPAPVPSGRFFVMCFHTCYFRHVNILPC